MRNRSNSLGSIFAVLLLGFSAEFAPAEIPWQRSPQAVFEVARQTGKPILVFVSADWCHYCKKMKRDTWSDPRVDAAVSQNFETLVLDGDRDKQIVSKLDLRGFPATLLYSPDGRFLDQKGGYMPPAQTLQWLSSMRR